MRWLVHVFGTCRHQTRRSLGPPEIEDLLSHVVKGISGAQNRVRYTMNGLSLQLELM